MSSYKNFVTDFPSRCLDILNEFEMPAIRNDREVSLLLMTATAAFVTPFERLQPKPRKIHVSNDKDTYKNAADQLKAIWTNSFLKSELWNEKAGSWCFGKAEFDGNNIFSPSESKTLKGQTIQEVFSRIRNALAHGNVYTINEPSINALYFVASDEELSKDYKFIAASPQDFKKFLEKWRDFLCRYAAVSQTIQDTPNGDTI